MTGGGRPAGGQTLDAGRGAPALTTARLELRPLRHDDLADLVALLGDGEGLAEWGPALSRAECVAWIDRNQRRYRDSGLGRCAVTLRSTGEFVGDAGLIPTVVEGHPEVELGWVVSRKHRRAGIATEAAAAWLDWGFGTLGLPRVVSMIKASNTASRRVAEKLGMSVEREADWGGLPHLMYVAPEPGIGRAPLARDVSPVSAEGPTRR